MDDRVARLGWRFTAHFLLFLTSYLVLAGAVFAAGRPLSGWILPAAYGSAFAAAWILPFRGRVRKGSRLLDTVLIIGFHVLLVMIATWFLDTSYDGQAYHKETILQLAGGWNPLKRHLLPTDTKMAIWLNHYPRGMELAQAGICRFTGHVESGKAINLGGLAAAFLLALEALPRLGSPRHRFPLAVIAAANPFTVGQSLSTYVDGSVALYFTTAILAGSVLSMVAWRERNGRVDEGAGPRWPWILVFSASLFLLAGAKFSGLGYAILLLAFLGAVLLVLHPRRALLPLAAGGGALALSLSLVAVNPCWSNYRDHGHPFYPLRGSDNVGQTVAEIAMAPDFIGRSTLYKYTHSIFGQTSGSSARPSVLKVPFTIHGRREFASYVLADTRVGGFGPFFSGILLTSILLACCAFPNMPGQERRLTGLLALAIILTVAANPEGWSARYAPQLWLLPWILCRAAVLQGTGRRWRLATGFLASVYLLDLGLHAGGYLAFNAYFSHRIRTEMAGLRPGVHYLVSFGEFRSVRAWFQERGLEFEEMPADAKVPGAWRTLCFTGDQVRYAVPSSSE